jgi:hypothetical protein
VRSGRNVSVASGLNQIKATIIRFVKNVRPTYGMSIIKKNKKNIIKIRILYKVIYCYNL